MGTDAAATEPAAVRRTLRLTQGLSSSRLVQIEFENLCVLQEVPVRRVDRQFAFCAQCADSAVRYTAPVNPRSRWLHRGAVATEASPSNFNEFTMCRSTGHPPPVIPKV